MSIRITQLSANNIRGIRQITLPMDKNILVLGENGCGKSSIVDAIEYYFTGRVEKISGRQDVLENLSLQFAGGGPLKVALRFSDDENEYPVTFPYLMPDIPRSLRDFFKSAAERPFILRRSQLLEFIEARPAERFELVSNLIALGNLDDIEEIWKRKTYAVSDRLKDERDILERIEKQLFSLLGTKTGNEQQIIERVNQKFTEHGITPITQYTDLASRKTDVHRKSINPENIRKAEQIRQLKRKGEDLQPKFEEIITAYDQLFMAWQLFLSNAKKADEASFEKLLIEGLEIATQNTLDKCPICEEPIADQNALICRLEERTRALQSFTKSREAMEKKAEEFSQLGRGISRLIRELCEELSRLEFKENADLLANHLAAKLDPWLYAMVQKPFNLISTQEFQSNSILDDAKNMLAGILTAAEKQVLYLTPSAEENSILELVEFLGRLDELWLAWIKTSAQKRSTEKHFDQLAIIHGELLAAKKRGLDRILSQLDDTFIRLYRLIHPEEGYKTISLKFPRNRDGSISLEAHKEGSEAMHPLGIFSEGHLDSLGICIFLAFIKRVNGDFKFIVLDDILTSIDAGHRMRIAKLISSEFHDYQIILTTHDEFWANEVGMIFENDKLPLGTIRMNPWNTKDGATYSGYTHTDWNHYLNEIANGRRQDAIAGVGRMFEGFLYTMRKNLHIAIPATFDDRYTIGDLYGPFFSWVEKHPIIRPDIPDFADRVSILKDELDDYWRLRNWSGAHYNDWGGAVSTNEATIFVELIAELVSYFECPACERLVVYDVSKKIVHCPNCKPKPVAKFFWLYKPTWKKQAENLKAMISKPGKEINIIRMSQSAVEKSLKDPRRKLGLTLPATTNDEYGLAEIYSVLVDFAKLHPRFSDEVRQKNLCEGMEMLFSFMTPEYTWIEPESIENKSDLIFDAALRFSELLECSSCGELVSYDQKEHTYFCAKCDKTELVEAPGAHWFTE